MLTLLRYAAAFLRVSPPPPAPLSPPSKTQGAVVVGREAPADVTIPIVTVSSAHARLEVVGGGLEIEDLGSTNGTFIDGIELKPNTKAALTVGQELVLGDMHLAAFTLVDEPEA